MDANALEIDGNAITRSDRECYRTSSESTPAGNTIRLLTQLPQLRGLGSRFRAWNRSYACFICYNSFLLVNAVLSGANQAETHSLHAVHELQGHVALVGVIAVSETGVDDHALRVCRCNRFVLGIMNSQGKRDIA